MINNKFEISKEKEECTDKEEQRKTTRVIGSGYAATEAAESAIKQAAKKYAKPDTYSGNRTLYDSPKAKQSAKTKAFASGEPVTDPYTGEELCKTIKEAKRLYGKDWQKHVAESDHITPLQQVHEETKNNVWNTVEDIQEAANSDKNIKVISRQNNNAKRNKTNTEYVENEEYLKDKGVRLTQEGKEQAIEDEKTSKKAIQTALDKSAGKNILETFNDAGMQGAKNAGLTALTTAGIMNIVSVIKGEKTIEEALSDTAKAGGLGTVTGYGMSGALTVISHTLSNSSSKFLQGLIQSNIPGKIVTAVMVTGDTLKKWGNGEITTQECLIQLGDKGLNMTTMGMSMAIGQAMIPIPVVGGAVGALVGSVLTSTLYKNTIEALKARELEHQERIRITEECRRAVEQIRKYREELEKYLQSYLQECRECFESALSTMYVSFETGDADGVIASANDITRKLGGNVQYETIDEYMDFLDSDEVEIF